MKINQILGKTFKRNQEKVNIDQFLNSNYARKSSNFINILDFLFGVLYATIRYGCKMKNDAIRIRTDKSRMKKSI